MDMAKRQGTMHDYEAHCPIYKKKAPSTQGRSSVSSHGCRYALHKI